MGLFKSARPRLEGNYSTPARADLAIAISELKAHDELTARLKQASPALQDALWDAYRTLDEAEHQNKGAVDAGGAHALATAVGEVLEAPVTPAGAARRLQLAQGAVETAQAAIELADRETREAEAKRPELQRTVDHLAAVVLRESPAVATLEAKMDKVLLEAALLAGEFNYLVGSNVIENRTNLGWTLDSDEARALDRKRDRLIGLPWNYLAPQSAGRMDGDRWADALAALKVDANAPVPGANG